MYFQKNNRTKIILSLLNLKSFTVYKNNTIYVLEKKYTYITIILIMMLVLKSALFVLGIILFNSNSIDHILYYLSQATLSMHSKKRKKHLFFV